MLETVSQQSATDERLNATVVAAIPAYNEARFIGSIVIQCRRFADIVLVIDDGSRDETAAIAEAAGAMGRCHQLHSGREGE